MVHIMEEILIKLAEGLPVIAVLILCIRYFVRKEKDFKVELLLKDNHIQELNDESRKNDRESLLIISKLKFSIDKFLEINDRNKEEILKEINILKKRFEK